MNNEPDVTDPVPEANPGAGPGAREASPRTLDAGVARGRGRAGGFRLLCLSDVRDPPVPASGRTELAIALAVKQAAPVVTILCAAIAVICLVAFWPRFRWGRRALATLFALVACGSIWLARFNVYEIMFHPMGTPAVEPAQTAKIDPDDMVLAVNVNHSARAYPIRTMGYHHIANDWVGGEPIVATY